ncbi:MAG: hypothetical protein SYC29_10705 [Planctomycetota bacterium]|nr:hypothetical protein [Planctomycetota bacterium]
MTRTRIRLTRTIGLASVLLAAAAASSAQATVRYWEPADGIGNWDYGPYWSPSGVPVAGDDARIEAGGDGWTLICNYINATNPLLDDIYIGNYTSDGTADGRLVQYQDDLHADDEFVGYYGTGTHYQSGGTVTLDSNLVLGCKADSTGYYELHGGSLTCAYPFIGFHGDGDFLQTLGTHTCNTLRIANCNEGGSYGYGTYVIEGGTLDAQDIYLGGKNDGDFIQLGGTVNATDAGLTLGLDQYGAGYYYLANGTLDSYRTRLSWAGSEFTHVGGAHEITGNLEIGYGVDVANEARYTLAEIGQLTVDGDMIIGDIDDDGGWGLFLQYGGTAVIGGTVFLEELAGNPTGWMELNDGSFTAVSVDNEGYIVLDGGVFTTDTLDNHGNFDQNAGAFIGELVNHGTFTYDGGVFAQSILTNHGTVNLNADFTCRRVVNDANITLVWDRWITADGIGHPNAVENNGNLSMYPDSHIDVGHDSMLVNNGAMYAGGPGSEYAHIFGDVVNYGYLLPCHSGLPSGQLYINGNFTAHPGAELRMRIHGTDSLDYDHLAVQETATLAGELDVRLTDDFVPDLGDSFSVVACLTRIGQFNPVNLPELPNDWEWQLDYDAQEVTLTVVEAQEECPADFDGDGDVDTADLLHLLGCWGDGCGDVDGDGDTDTADLLALLGAWGQCP